MDINEIKKLALLGIAGGLLLTAGSPNQLYADDQGDNGGLDKEANGCSGNDGCSGKNACNGHGDRSESDEDSDEDSDKTE